MSANQTELAFTMEEAVLRLGVSEATVREWIGSFHWERRYDGTGNLILMERDLDFLRLIKSLKEVDRSCDSIVKLIECPLETPPEEAPPAPEHLGQIATLKDALRELHAAPPRRPFWKFWTRS